MKLSPDEARLFYKLYFALLAYTSRQLKVVDNVTRPNDIVDLGSERTGKIRDALHAHPEVLEQFISENPEGFSPDELAIVGSWRHRIEGEFHIIRYLRKYAVFMSPKAPSHLYGVVALTDPIEVVLRGRPLPAWVKAVLLPFRDKIIYDGLLMTYSLFFGKGIRTSFNETYNRLKEREGIIERLVGPDGKPETTSSLSRRAPKKPAPDWQPVVDEIVAQADKLRQADTPLQGAAFGLLRAAALFAQATLSHPDQSGEHLRQLKSVHRALTKLEKQLYED